MDPISIGIVGFGFYKLIQFITKEDEFVQTEKDENQSEDLLAMNEQDTSKEIPYNS